MPSIEIIIWVLTGVVTVISILGGTVWSLMRAEAAQQAELLKSKADSDRLTEMETRWEKSLNDVKESNDKLHAENSRRAEREMDQLSLRLTDQIKNTETVILRQISLMFEAMKVHRE